VRDAVGGSVRTRFAHTAEVAEAPLVSVSSKKVSRLLREGGKDFSPQKRFSAVFSGRQQARVDRRETQEIPAYKRSSIRRD
jgi:hypothetical protein